jgi:hypothetical protein
MSCSDVTPNSGRTPIARSGDISLSSGTLRSISRETVPLPHLAARRPAIYGARRVLQTSQKWPETAGSKCRGFAKPGEKFQRPSPKVVVLPLHHSPRILEQLQYLEGPLGAPASEADRSSLRLRSSTRYIARLASPHASRHQMPQHSFGKCGRASAS